jgi:hypothetical protein
VVRAAVASSLARGGVSSWGSGSTRPATTIGGVPPASARDSAGAGAGPGAGRWSTAVAVVSASAPGRARARYAVSGRTSSRPLRSRAGSAVTMRPASSVRRTCSVVLWRTKLVIRTSSDSFQKLPSGWRTVRTDDVGRTSGPSGPIRRTVPSSRAPARSSRAARARACHGWQGSRAQVSRPLPSRSCAAAATSGGIGSGSAFGRCSSVTRSCGAAIHQSGNPSLSSGA